MTDDFPQRVAHGTRLGRQHLTPTLGRHVRREDAGLRQPLPREDEIRRTQRCSHEPRCRLAGAGCERSHHGPDHHTEARRRREPAQGLGPVVRNHRVGHVRLGDAGRPAAQALDETRHEQQPQRPGEPEDQVRQSRCGQPREQGWPPTVAVGHPPPHRRGNELRDGKGCGHQADRRRAGMEVERIQRQQRQDEGEPDHVDERDSHQHRHPLHRLAPSPSTTALTTIRITPNAAATPSSETRRLDMISMEIGRLSYV